MADLPLDNYDDMSVPEVEEALAERDLSHDQLEQLRDHEAETKDRVGVHRMLDAQLEGHDVPAAGAGAGPVEQTGEDADADTADAAARDEATAEDDVAADREADTEATTEATPDRETTAEADAPDRDAAGEETAADREADREAASDREVTTEAAEADRESAAGEEAAANREADRDTDREAESEAQVVEPGEAADTDMSAERAQAARGEGADSQPVLESDEYDAGETVMVRVPSEVRYAAGRTFTEGREETDELEYDRRVELAVADGLLEVVGSAEGGGNE